MSGGDFWCEMRMVRVWLVWLVVFPLLLAWAGAKHLSLDSSHLQDQDYAADVQDTIEDVLTTGVYSFLHLDRARAELVVPVRVTRAGALLSHELSQPHAHAHARTRRAAAVHDHLLPPSLHYNLTVAGKNLTLDLRPSTSFIGGALVVERHARGGRSRAPPLPAATACHYRGSVRAQPSSRLALSACDGLAGLMQTEEGEYWIEPSTHIPTDPSEGRAHIVYKRSAINKQIRSKRSVDRNNQERQRSHSKPEHEINHHSREPQGFSPAEIRRRRLNEARRRARFEEYSKRTNVDRRNQNKRISDRLNEDRRRIDNRRIADDVRLRNLHRANSSNFDNNTNRLQQNKKKLKGDIDPKKIKRRRRRKTKNCATREPPRSDVDEQWTRGQGAFELQRRRNQRRYNKQQNRRVAHRHVLSRRGGFEPARRSARSVSRQRNVEVLLVADHSMTDFHKRSNIEQYLLTIMNMVSSLFSNPTIGNFIRVVVVKIIVVEEAATSPPLQVSPSANATLASFCRWQLGLNPGDDKHPHHHDVAILITRQDICSRHDSACSTLGVAHVAGMCQPDRSCSVNEDNGMTLAHTITHELGHNFGLYHDTEKIGCRRREGSTLHIMTPIFEADIADVAWSRCSRRDVTNFLDAGLGECLADEPEQEEYSYPTEPAGVMFDAVKQCKLQFGVEATAVCADEAEICQHLWCLVNGTCRTQLRPAAPGTACGDDMWCQEQACVARSTPPRPQDGGWGAWGEWSACSRSCGAGVSVQRRNCDSPTPQHGGNFCVGVRNRYKVCNVTPCPRGEPGFRETQCSHYDNTTHEDQLVPKWTPYFDQDKPCDLYCMPPNQKDIVMFGEFAADGTPCRQNPGSRDMCISGLCHKVGCDWVVDSDAVEDACGICNGDGSNCKTVQGIYTKDITKQTGFSEVAVIPAGSRNVEIQEKVNPGNFITIGSANSPKVYLNGMRRNVNLTEYLVAGSPALYERDRDWEKVRIVGPLKEDIKVFQMIFKGRHRNPGVTFQYTVDRVARYTWNTTWGPCSVTCGRGSQRRRLICLDDNNVEADAERCEVSARPAEVMRQCERGACPPPPAHLPRAHHWWVGVWTDCDHHCIPAPTGRMPVMRRHVYCVDRVRNRVMLERNCDAGSKPPAERACTHLRRCA